LSVSLFEGSVYGAVADTFTPMGDFAASNSVTQIAVPISLLPRFYRVQVLPAN